MFSRREQDDIRRLIAERDAQRAVINDLAVRVEALEQRVQAIEARGIKPKAKAVA